MSDEVKAVAKPLNAYVSAKQLATDTSYDLSDLSAAYQTQAGLYAHYADLFALAQRQADRAKLSLEVMEARLDKEFREVASKAGTKTTEKQIENSIRLSPEYQSAAVRAIEAKSIANLAREALQAMSQRRDMLVQAGKVAFEERKGELRMLERASTDPAARIRQAMGVAE